jgi:PAS domain S-box-containing protein
MNEITPDLRGEAPSLQQARLRIAELEAALGQERRFYEAILSSTPDLVYVFNLNYRFTYANEALLQMWGRTWDTAIGKGLLELGYPDWHAAMHEREIDQVSATKKPFRGEVPFTGTNGRRIYDYIFVPVLNAAGEVEAVAGTTRDVTEMVAARETLAERRRELEHQVAERTIALRQMVEQLEEFSYSVSHDLRAPSRAITGYAGVLLQEHGGQLDESARAMIERIQRNGLRMQQLTEGLLAYTKLRGRLHDLASVRPEPVIAAVIDLYPQLHPEKAEILVRGPLPAVLADEHSLSQIVANLLNNAVKFVPAGRKPRVVITGETTPAATRLVFQDNGIGIDPSLQGRLFALFERVHPNAGYEGTGIGLAIVRKAMERMGGRAGVESDGVSGSRFWIEFPQSEAPRVVPNPL